MALGVAVLVVVQSVMGGFGEIHRDRIIDTSGHIDISAYGSPFPHAWDFVKTIEETIPAARITPYGQGFVMVEKGNIPVFPQVLGINAWENPVFDLENSLLAGSVEDLYDDTVLISENLSLQTGAVLGSPLTIYSPAMIKRISGDEVVLPRIVHVAGIYSVDWNPEFLPGLVCTLATLQDLYEIGDGVHGIAVRLEDLDADAFAAAALLREKIPDHMKVETWRERWASFLWVLDLEKTVMLFINLMIVAVAVFAIAVAQLLTVVRKTREIGLLRVLGGSRKGILGIYSFQGLIIGVVGTILGMVLAFTLLAFRDPIIDWLSAVSGTRETLRQYYYFSNLPVRYETGTLAFIATAAIGLSLLASWIPALRAARLRPADTLRVEQ